MTAGPVDTADHAGVGCRGSAPVGARRRVVLLTGPSSAGKRRLAARLGSRTGWPVVRLDDFYKQIDAPRLPRSGLGIPDWDRPDSWNVVEGVNSLRSLVEAGWCESPVHDIGRSAVTEHQFITANPDEFILAEGLFAARIMAPLKADGLLADAVCICRDAGRPSDSC